MHLIKSISIGIAAFASLFFNQNEVFAAEKFSVDASSAKMYLDMAGNAIDGELPADAQWEALFNSPAYKALLDNTQWDKNAFKSNVRGAFEIVFDPQNSQKCDSILSVLNSLDNLRDELPFYVSTAYNIRKNLNDYTTLLSSLNMDDVVNDADSLALALLPKKGEGLTAQSSPIYLIVWDLESRSLGGGLFLDLNSALHSDVTGLKEILGHEMHHFYLGPVFETIYANDVMDGAVAALVFNMREGVADIINKKKMPTESLFPYGEKICEQYNADYLNSPKVLEELDNVTCAYLDQKLPIEEYFNKAIGCAHYEGHTTGDYMVFLIRDRLGLDAVVESVGDLDAFVDNYNKAAKMAGTYVFSDKFTNHIHSVSQSAKRK